MPVHAAREHVATEAPARGDDDDHGHPTYYRNRPIALDREAHTPAITSEWAASFMHGFNNPDTVRASYMPRTGSSPLSDVRGPRPYGQNSASPG